MSETCRKLTLVIPGLDPTGLYDEEQLFPTLSNWLRQHLGTPPGLPDPPLYIGEGKVRAYRIFFLDNERVAAALTLSLYFDPIGPTQLSGLVTDAYWGEVRDIKPLLEVLVTVGYRLELSFVTVLTDDRAVYYRQFVVKGFQLIATGVPIGEASHAVHHYRIDLGMPEAMATSEIARLLGC